MGLSCQSSSPQKKIYESIAGDWLIVYPDHQLKGRLQRELYAGMQDSIVALTGLKLIRMSMDGRFLQLDSFSRQGEWKLSLDNNIYIRHGGRGFDNFRAEFASYKNGTLRLVEQVKAGPESIRLVWNLKRIRKNDPGADLFSDDRNEWRKKPVQRETKAEIKKRLSAMLEYYADYFKLVTRNASYFSPSRVHLPFKYYQHAIGLRDLTERSAFHSFFFDSTQAREAYRLLEQGIYNRRKDFPSASDFVEEYALFMDKLAEDVKK